MTMASIAQLEGTNTENRKEIVGVFENRLNSGYNLGSDVTTYYAFQESMKKDLTAEQFNTANPYNTRGPQMIGKMPVGPICNPNNSSIEAAVNPTASDNLFFVADKKKVAQTALGALRSKLGKDLGLIDENKYSFLWVTNFPMFEYVEEENRYVAAHHPFTSPNLEDVDKLMTDQENCYSRAYDLVLNGYELLSGSIRIHDQKLQEKVFEAIGMTMEEAHEKFGFFIDAFRYGTPPHGGVGIGLERLIMILTGTDNIRDVVAFPKTASASDLMSEAPNLVDEKQLKELGIKIVE
jgi:aspartyl-tRNA synthetase